MPIQRLSSKPSTFAEAMVTLQPFITLASCINAMCVAALSDKGSCLDVTRIQGWTALSFNAVQFQVVYTAADSAESAPVRT